MTDSMASTSSLPATAKASAKAPERSLFQLCYPLFLHSVLSFVVVLLDTMIISSYSDEAAAAVNIANQVLTIAYEFSVLFGVGGVILIARSLGRGDGEKAREIAKITLLANMVFNAFISVLMAILAPSILRWINTPAEIFENALLYVYICSGSLVLNGFIVAALPCLRGFGLTKIIFLMGIFSQSFYLGIEYVLILGWGPIEGMGVLGSALGTMTLRVVAAVCLAVIVVRALRLKMRLLMPVAEIKSLLKQLFKLSYPSVSNSIANGLYQLVLIGFIAGLGVAALLSRGYTMVSNQFLTLVIMVVSQGNEVLLGYQTGAGDMQTARHRAIKSCAWAMLLATGFALVFYLFSSQFIGLFTDDPEILSTAKQLMLLNIILQPVFAMNAILFNSLKVVGDVNWPVIADQLVTWLVSLPLAYIAAVVLGYGVVGIWCVFILEESIKSALMWRRWHRQLWASYSM